MYNASESFFALYKRGLNKVGFALTDILHNSNETEEKIESHSLSFHRFSFPSDVQCMRNIAITSYFAHPIIRNLERRQNF